MDGLADNDRKWLGVANHVSDLERLATRIIEVATGPEASSSPYLRRIPTLGVREIHEFIRNFAAKVRYILLALLLSNLDLQC